MKGKMAVTGITKKTVNVPEIGDVVVRSLTGLEVLELNKDLVHLNDPKSDKTKFNSVRFSAKYAQMACTLNDSPLWSSADEAMNASWDVLDSLAEEVLVVSKLAQPKKMEASAKDASKSN